MFDLSDTMILSFEIIDDCNLKYCHTKCPITVRKSDNAKYVLNTEKIIQCMQQAKNLNFNGYIAFHLYNEPLIAKEKMLFIIEKLPDFKYLLWTNGLLLDKVVENNNFLKKFDLVNISCYDKVNLDFFQQIKKFHGKVHIFCEGLDDRLDIYTREYENLFGCKRPLFEIPIDYAGNILLCCNDWNNSFKIGNVFESMFEEIILSPKYQELLECSKKRLLDQKICPPICKKCNNPMITYKRYLKIYEDKNE